MKRRIANIAVLLGAALVLLLAQTGSITLNIGGREIVIRLRPLSTVTFDLSSTTATAAGAATLDLSISSTRRWPAGLQFELAYPATVSSIEVTAGPAALEAGKTVQCAFQGTGVLRCLVFGAANTTPIQPGIVARVAAVVTGDATIDLQGLVASTAAGGALNVMAGTSGTITLPTLVQDVTCTSPTWDTALPMGTFDIEPMESISCTVRISQPAPAGGFAVPVAGIDQGVMVSDTTVAAGETEKAFTISR